MWMNSAHAARLAPKKLRFAVPIQNSVVNQNHTNNEFWAVGHVLRAEQTASEP